MGEIRIKFALVAMLAGAEDWDRWLGFFVLFFDKEHLQQKGTSEKSLCWVFRDAQRLGASKNINGMGGWGKGHDHL